MSDLCGNPEDRFSRVAALVRLLHLDRRCVINVLTSSLTSSLDKEKAFSGRAFGTINFENIF